MKTIYCVECQVVAVAKTGKMCGKCIREEDELTLKAIGPRGWSSYSPAVRCVNRGRYVGPRVLA